MPAYARNVCPNRTAVLWAVLVIGLLAPAEAGAQAGGLRWKSVPLDVALLEFAEAADVDLVFAHRLVAGRRVSGVWNPGEDPAETLADLLEGTRLRAERIRSRQFVIIAEPLNVAVEPGDPAAYTGALTGQIVDAESGLPLPGAHALLVDLDIGGVADGQGWFVIPRLPTGTYTVQFSYVGYRSVRLSLSVYPETSLLPPTIRLRAEAFTLGGATVRPRPDPSPGAGATDLAGAGRSPGRQAAALTPDAGAGDLLRVLDWLPGVARSPAAGAGLSVRGLDPSLMRTYRDGAPVLEPAHAAGLSAPFQPEAQRTVRLHRGTPPPELAGGLAGALEVEPHDGRGESASGVAGAGPLALRGVIAIPIGASAGLAAAARHSALGWPSRAWPTAPVVHHGADGPVLDPLGGSLRAGDEGTEASYAFDDVEATLSASFTPRQRFTLGGWTAGDRLSSGGAAGYDARWRSATASLRHRALVGETFLLASIYGSRYSADEHAPGAAREYVADLTELGLRVEGDQYLSIAHTLRAGIALSRRRLEAALETPDRSSGMAGSGTEAGAWIQDVWRPSEDWQVEVGVRGESFGPHRRLSPRVLARWSAVAGLLHVRGGAGRQVQGLLRLPDPGPATPPRASARWVLAGRDEAPAEAWQAGVGIEWAPLYGLALSADAYARRLRALPEPRDDARAQDAVSQVEIDSLYARVEGRGAGLELAARAEGGPWILGVTYAAAVAQTREPPGSGSEVSGPWRRARHDRPHTLGMFVQHEGRKWHASARVDALARTPGDLVSPVMRVELAVGFRFAAAGVQWDTSLRAQPTAARGNPPVTPGAAGASIGPLAFAADGATLPAWPVFSIRAAW